MQEAKAILRASHRLTSRQPDDFTMTNQEDILSIANSITKILTIFLAGIAAISLLVGGIGIMNIMLVSVTERTIRMAIGAKNRDILMQFLIEALILSTLGGVTGIVIGVSLYILYTFLANQPFILSLLSIFGSFISAAMVGIISGYYPAKKASKLNPIDALRYE